MELFYEPILKNILQQNVKFTINNKIIRRGKVLLFKQIHFNIEFTLEHNDKLRKLEIPTPFNIEYWEKDNLIYCDYRTSNLTKWNSELKELFLTIPKVGNNKYYDKILEINIIKKK